MSIPALNWCIEQRDLPPGEWVVLFHLAHCHNHDTGRCDPSQEYLAAQTNMGGRTVRRHLSSLESKGRIFRKGRGVEGGGRLSDYYVLGHEPAKLAANVTGQSMRANRPNDAQNVHEMAAKQEVTGIEHEVPPIVPHPEIQPDPAKPPPKASLPGDWVPSDEDRGYAVSLQLLDNEITEIANDFRGYWTESPKTKRTERGWHQTWKNRCLDIAPKFKRNRPMAGKAKPGGYGQGGSIASIVAQRWAED